MCDPLAMAVHRLLDVLTVVPDRVLTTKEYKQAKKAEAHVREILYGKPNE